MSDVKIIYIFISVLAACVVIFALLKPFGMLLHLLLNSAAGACFIALSNLLLKPIGIHMGLNVMNALVIGIMGIPGYGALLIIQKFI